MRCHEKTSSSKACWVPTPRNSLLFIVWSARSKLRGGRSCGSSPEETTLQRVQLFKMPEDKHPKITALSISGIQIQLWAAGRARAGVIPPIFYVLSIQCKQTAALPWGLWGLGLTMGQDSPGLGSAGGFGGSELKFWLHRDLKPTLKTLRLLREGCWNEWETHSMEEPPQIKKGLVMPHTPHWIQSSAPLACFCVASMRINNARRN